MARLCLVLFFLVGCILNCVFSINDELVAKLDSTISITKAAIDGMHTEWQVDKYPNFLKSCFMQKMSWEIMRLKYQKKVIESFKSAAGAPKTKFVISFTGRCGSLFFQTICACYIVKHLLVHFYSSVSAGHDNHFNTSAPVVTGQLMKDAFSPLGIDLETRNVALGNNPCTPYDVCVKYFGGLDADVVHWEQTYFCADNRPVIEQFIRQAMAMPNKPIVVFSDSHSGKWFVVRQKRYYEIYGCCVLLVIYILFC